MTPPTPVLLLKTRSTPVDGYYDVLASLDGAALEPVFVPVLEHRFRPAALDHVRRLLTGGGFVGGTQAQPRYGAVVFTSQRAVEAFAAVVGELRDDHSVSVDCLLPHTVPCYVVGPATARGLRALQLRCPVVGEETGNGEALAALMLRHYNALYAAVGAAKPPVLFLVGEQRRDVVPKALQSAELPPASRIRVDELVVYETSALPSFQSDFCSRWQANQARGVARQWVVVFSPTGCRAVLDSLGLLDRATNRARPALAREDVLVAAIGPTTRRFLEVQFGFSPAVCAAAPSPEGVAQAIGEYVERETAARRRYAR